jgi:ABC-type amino acid transport substrate-binding protein
MRKLLLVAPALALALVSPTIARANTDNTPAKKLVVGVFPSAPTAIRDANGTWSGFCVDAWVDVARETGLSYEFRAVEAKDVMERGLAALGVDVIPCVPPNPRTEAVMDVTHPFWIGGIGIAARPEARSGVDRVAHKLFDWHFLRNLGLLLLVIVAIGVIVWWIERHTSPEDFGGPPLKGIGGGIFWTVESMFSKPKPLSRKLRSRLLALFWVIVSIVIISGITARLAAEFTVNQLTSTVNGPKDLAHVRVGVAMPSTNKKTAMINYLDRRGIPYRTYHVEKAAELVAALDRGEVDAVISDFYTLKYLAVTEFSGRIVVLPDAIAPTPIGFGLAPGSALRKQIDVAIVKLVEQEDFKQIGARYYGATD